MDNKINRKGQAVIFVIVALFIVVAVVFVFVSVRRPSFESRFGFDPESSISQCVRKSANELVDKMIAQGGFASPSDSVVYNGINVTYVCKNINYYDPCIAQYPAFIKTLASEVKANIQNDVENCLESLENELGARNYEFSRDPTDLAIKLRLGIVEIKIDTNLSIRKESNAQSFKSFKVNVNTPLYDLAGVAQEIIKQETQFCYFSTDGFSLLYNEFDVRRDVLSDSTKIYSIKDKNTGKTMNVAIRGCVIPAGF